MPTGYTHDVADGKLTDFATFALRCARAFGATIMQRDNPMDEPPQLQEPSDFYAKAIETAKARIVALDAMSVDEAETEAAREYGESLKANAAYAAEKDEKRNRYNAMLAEVMAWEPPTPDHVGMKDFMVQQLTDSRKFDCDGTYQPYPLVRVSGAMWLARSKADARESLARAEKNYAEEVERTNGRNAWITALYESLNAKVPA